jgi:predicted nucleotidyltransferase
MKSPEAALEEVLAKYVMRAKALEQRLVSIIQFGSTVRGPLKRETDIDLLLIFEKLPVGRLARSEIVEGIEKVCLEELTKNLPKDYNICFSSKLKTVEESQRFSILYLDMVDRSKILFDPRGLASSLIEKTKNWIQQSGAYRVEKGLKWYWVLGKDASWDEESPIGWQ